MSQLNSLLSDDNQTTLYSDYFSNICTVVYSDSQGSRVKSPCILTERTVRDGPMNIFIGSPVHFWLTKILVMDFLRLFSRKKILRFDRKRSILIDIDDMFVAPTGLKMIKDDVQVSKSIHTDRI